MTIIRLILLFFAFLVHFDLLLGQQKDSLLKHFAHTLVRPTDSDSIKVVHFYTWIAENIRYDDTFDRKLNGEPVLTQEPDVVFSRRKAACGGYAKLFKTFCATQGIIAEIIEGYAKTYTFNTDFEKNGHAWNVVQINQCWYLIDATWASGNRQNNRQLYEYFAPKPEDFIETHFPFDPMWQLLERPFSLSEFKKGYLDNTLKTPIFHFQDSIATHQNLDSLNKIIKTALHGYQVNPRNKLSLVELGDFYFKKGRNSYEKYIAIRKTAYEQKKPLTQKELLFQLLTETDTLFQQSAHYYRQLIALYPSNRYTDAHFNLNVVQDNLESLEEERVYLKKYFTGRGL